MLAAENPISKPTKPTSSGLTKLGVLLLDFLPLTSPLRGRPAETIPSVPLKGSPTAEQTEAFVETRAKVLSLPQTLPNIICKQSTDRFAASSDEPTQVAPDAGTAGSSSHALYGTPVANAGTRKQTATVTYAHQDYTVSKFRPPRDIKWKYGDTI